MERGQREAVEEEMRRRMREEAEAGLLGPSPSASPSYCGMDGENEEPRTLAFSPRTAANLLSRLGPAQTPARAGEADTIVLPRAASPERARAADVFTFSAREKQRRAPERGGSAVWPSRQGRAQWVEGPEGRRRARRFLVLKNKTLYVWKSEHHYKVNQGLKRILDLDFLRQMEAERTSTKLGGKRWRLRMAFDGETKTYAIVADSKAALENWRTDLKDSSPLE